MHYAEAGQVIYCEGVVTPESGAAKFIDEQDIWFYRFGDVL